jgi:hypothetical protein
MAANHLFLSSVCSSTNLLQTAQPTMSMADHPTAAVPVRALDQAWEASSAPHRQGRSWPTLAKRLDAIARGSHGKSGSVLVQHHAVDLPLNQVSGAAPASDKGGMTE